MNLTVGRTGSVPGNWNTSVIFVLNFTLLFQARNGTQSLALPMCNEIY